MFEVYQNSFNLIKFITCRSFLEERLAFCSQEPSDKLKQKWLLEDFPSWLQQMVTSKLYDECFSSITLSITNVSAQLFRLLIVLIITQSQKC